MSEAQNARNTRTQTHSGKMFDIFNPTPEDICIEDIAHALAMQCRFNGHTKEFYSVAEHSLNVARIVNHLTSDPKTVMHALMHDAHEAYLGDLPGPWADKILFYDNDKSYTRKQFVYRIDNAIMEALDLRWIESESKELVGYADLAMLLNEKGQALAVNNIPWSTDSFVVQSKHLLTKLEFFKPAEACFNFLKAYEEITKCLQTGQPVSSLPVLSLSHLRT